MLATTYAGETKMNKTYQWNQTMKTATIREGSQFIGVFSVENAPNELIRRLVANAIENGEATAKDEEGCEITAVAD
jgi:hypothetical protein